MCYVGHLKGNNEPIKCEAGSQKYCKDLANTKLDLRNAANSLQIVGNWGCYLGTQPMAGGVERRRTGPYIWGRGQGGALSGEKLRDVLGEAWNTC